MEGLIGDPSTKLRTGFVYLRTRRIPAEAVLSRIEHEQVWTALQLIHAETLQPYATGKEIQTVELSDDRKLVYCIKVNEDILAQLLDLAGGMALSWCIVGNRAGCANYYPMKALPSSQSPPF